MVLLITFYAAKKCSRFLKGLQVAARMATVLVILQLDVTLTNLVTCIRNLYRSL